MSMQCVFVACQLAMAAVFVLCVDLAYLSARVRFCWREAAVNRRVPPSCYSLVPRDVLERCPFTRSVARAACLARVVLGRLGCGEMSRFTTSQMSPLADGGLGDF